MSKLHMTVDEIDAILPQTQCGECGYAGCKPYAEALATHQASIDLCPPGGIQGLIKLAAFSTSTLRRRCSGEKK